LTHSEQRSLVVALVYRARGVKVKVDNIYAEPKRRHEKIQSRTYRVGLPSFNALKVVEPIGMCLPGGADEGIRGG